MNREIASNLIDAARNATATYVSILRAARAADVAFSEARSFALNNADDTEAHNAETRAHSNALAARHGLSYARLAWVAAHRAVEDLIDVSTGRAVEEFHKASVWAVAMDGSLRLDLLSEAKTWDARITARAELAIAKAEPDATPDVLTPETLVLFLALAKDAGNWGGTPMIGKGSNIPTTKADQGRITEMKTKGLIHTGEDRGNTFVYFLPPGVELAAAHGVGV